MVNALQIGNYLSSLRKSKGLTQDDLASTLSISRQAISKWETGLFIEKFIEFKPIHAMKTHNELWTRVPERMLFKARKIN